MKGSPRLTTLSKAIMRDCDVSLATAKRAIKRAVEAKAISLETRGVYMLARNAERYHKS